MITPQETLARYPAHDFTLAGALASRCAVGPDRPFLVEGERSWSYGAFVEEVAAAAQLLVDAGVGRGDRVAVVAPTNAVLVTALFASARLGAIFVPINPDLRPEEAAPIIARARPRLVIHAEELEGLARQASTALGPQPSLMTIGAGFGNFARRPRLARETPAPAANSTCLVLFTSGTTGMPKGVMHAQHSFIVAGEGFVERQWIQPDDRMLCILPMFHVNALFYSLGGALAAGATLVLGGKFSASRFWPLVSARGATQVNMLGSIGKILALRPRDEFVAGHRLDRVYCVPLAGDVQRAFTAEFADKNPKTVKAVLKGLHDASVWLDDLKNRHEQCEIVSRPNYINCQKEVILGRLLGQTDYGDGRKIDDPNYMIFNQRNCNYPQAAYGRWWLTQLRRWGMLTAVPDYEAVSKEVMRGDLYAEAMAELSYKHGGLDDTPWTMMDKVTFDPKGDMEAYAKGFAIQNVKG